MPDASQRPRVAPDIAVGGTVEEREARGAWALAPFDGLIVDWDKVYRGIDTGV
jgi:hypothetical protein